MGRKRGVMLSSVPLRKGGIILRSRTGGNKNRTGRGASQEKLFVDRVGEEPSLGLPSGKKSIERKGKGEKERDHLSNGGGGGKGGRITPILCEKGKGRVNLRGDSTRKMDYGGNSYEGKRKKGLITKEEKPVKLKRKGKGEREALSVSRKGEKEKKGSPTFEHGRRGEGPLPWKTF